MVDPEGPDGDVAELELLKRPKQLLQLLDRLVWLGEVRPGVDQLEPRRLVDALPVEEVEVRVPPNILRVPEPIQVGYAGSGSVDGCEELSARVPTDCVGVVIRFTRDWN